MPNSVLFATNNEGRIYALSTGQTSWKEFHYSGIEFKKISAVKNVIYAIGSDRKVYVLVHSLDIPIRVKEECYENERWFPIEGFTNRLFPTDRKNFSNSDGTENRAVESIRLPSACWIWEGDWTLDCTLNGESLNHDGWTYAIDFPAKFYSKKLWNSCVRRRKWIRTRRFSKMNSWCALAPLHKDATQEPFVDVSIACVGTDTQTFSLSVWAVSAHGRVMHRAGVSMASPEGQRWTVIPTPSEEVSSISVGGSGLVWAILISGKALVRCGIRSENLIGDKWVEVESPKKNLRILQASVGTNSVWCVTNDFHCWFRRGIKGEISGISEEASHGSGWVEMVGNVSEVSVAANDHVFAIGSNEDRHLYYRWGVNSLGDLTGKRWVKINCPMQCTSKASSTISLSSQKTGSESPAQRLRNLNFSYKEKGRVETSAIIENIDIEDIAHSMPNIHHKSKYPNSPPCSLNENVVRYKLRMDKAVSSAPNEHLSRHPRAWSPVRSIGSMVGTEAYPESDSSLFESDPSQGSCIFSEEDDTYGTYFWSDLKFSLKSCAAGAVVIESNQLPIWFGELIISSESVIDVNIDWRKKIMMKLYQRIPEHFVSSNYERAIHTSSWVKSCEAKVSKCDDSFDDCLIELEWLSSVSLGLGTLTILNVDGVTTILQLPLSEITCVMCCSEPGIPRIAIYMPRLSPNVSPLKFQFTNDTDMEDWLSYLTSVCCELNEIHGPPSSDAKWMTTNLGDVFCFDPSSHKIMQYNNDSKIYEKDIDMLGAETPYNTPLPNGMIIGSILEITGCIYDDASQIRFDLQCHSTLKNRFVVDKMRHVACHLNPRFDEKTIVFNSMENSEWQVEIITGNMLFSLGSEFKLEIR